MASANSRFNSALCCLSSRLSFQTKTNQADKPKNANALKNSTAFFPLVIGFSYAKQKEKQS